MKYHREKAIRNQKRKYEKEKYTLHLLSLKELAILTKANYYKEIYD